MTQPRVAAQLIIYGDRAQRDLPGVLAEVATAGYAGVEGGTPANAEQIAEMRQALAVSNLAYAGGHCGLGQLGDPSVVAALARGVSGLGGRFLLVSGRADSLDGYRAAAQTLDQAGRVCREAGIALCYHNHNWEFHQIEGIRPIDLLVGETDPALVQLCPDVYWVHVGGDRPDDFIVRHRERCPYFHFKDGLGGERYQEFRPLGEGRVDLKRALEAALSCEPEWVTVEQDHTDGEPADAIRASRQYLKSLGL